MAGGGSSYSHTRPEELRDKIRQSQSELDRTKYDGDVNGIIDTNLGSYNKRNIEAIKTHIEEIKNALNQEIDGYVQTSFGGSVSKHTYVDGLSDIDALVTLNQSELADMNPEQVRDYFFKKLKERFPATEIDKGNLAVTVNFTDAQIQLLPAIKYHNGLKISDWSGKNWSEIIRPNVFARALRIRNGAINGKLIPTIKLAKAIISNLPASKQISGYHCEALALKIFQDFTYSGQTTKEVLKHFFKEAVTHIRNPIKDKTGQSTFVDSYLGVKGSLPRLKMADAFERISRKMEEADNTLSSTFWKDNLEQNG